MSATAKNGDVWTEEEPVDGWWTYTDRNGDIYESREIPVYRIVMDNATQIRDDKGRLCIAPINPL